ncbi:MAG: hypothetical protein ABW109_21380, partial [Candidatus Thiodiazotropha sp. 6PLUC4]
MTSIINIISRGRLLLIFFFIPLDIVALEPLPTPLSLEYALSLADDGHPERVLADAALAQSEAEKLEADAGDDLRIDVSAELRAIEP